MGVLLNHRAWGLPVAAIAILTASLAASSLPIQLERTAPLLDVEVLTATPSVDATSMLAEHKTWVKTYPVRQGNVAEHRGARDYLATEFAAAGYTVWRQNFSPNVNGIPQQNVCGVKLGSLNDQIWVVIGGHLDSTTQDGIGDPSPVHEASEGAYDDGSGVRMMMSMAKAWKDTDNDYSILWCAFDGEERGTQGAAKVKQAMDNDMLPGGFPWPIQDIRGMIEMDMFGLNWPLRAPIYVHENSAAVQSWITDIRIAKGIPTDMLKFSDLRIAGTIALGTSDYIHWMNAGIPTAFFISDFSELGIPGTGLAPTAPVPAAYGVYPFWHFVDTWETMTAMAGGDATLDAAFQNGVDIAGHTLALFALHPEIDL